MYEIIISDKAKKQLRKLSPDLRNRMGRTLERIRIRPYHFVERIVNSSYFKLRIGEHRIILNIKNKQLIIYVIKLGHRKNIYKN